MHDTAPQSPSPDAHSVLNYFTLPLVAVKVITKWFLLRSDEELE